MRIIKDTNYDFMSKVGITRILSILVLSIGLMSLIINKGPKLSIDFKGGTMIVMNFEKAMEIERLRNSLNEIIIDGQTFDLSNAEIKFFGDQSDILMRFSNISSETDKFLEKFTQKLYQTFPNKVPQQKEDFILSFEKVSPKIGSELSSDALMAIISALTLILIYISVRFEFKYAIGAIAALGHDIFITLGVFSIFNFEISLAVIAAFLTIVGYSLNDTIVIFDRIRENTKGSSNVPLGLVVNQSINESLSRTIITSLTTFMVVFILFLVGGEIIHSFAFAMIIGVLVGTYSSVFIASPIVIAMDKNRS